MTDRAWLVVLFVVFVLTALTDVYTTKRAILDHYHGWKLGNWERNKLVRWLWKAAGVNRLNAHTPGAQPEGFAMLVLHKAAFVGIGYVLHRWSPQFALVWLGVLSALQAWASIANRRLLHAKRKLVDSKRRA